MAKKKNKQQVEQQPQIKPRFVIEFDNWKISIKEWSDYLLLNPLWTLEVAFAILKDLYENYYDQYKPLLKDQNKSKKLAEFILLLILTGSLTRFLLYFEPLFKKWWINKEEFIIKASETNYTKVSEEFLKFLEEELKEAK